MAMDAKTIFKRMIIIGNRVRQGGREIYRNWKKEDKEKRW